jgi:hypothetical protein
MLVNAGLIHYSDRLWAGQLGFNFWWGQEIFLFSIMSGPVEGLTGSYTVDAVVYFTSAVKSVGA